MQQWDPTRPVYSPDYARYPPSYSPPPYQYYPTQHPPYPPMNYPYPYPVYYSPQNSPPVGIPPGSPADQHQHQHNHNYTRLEPTTLFQQNSEEEKNENPRVVPQPSAKIEENMKAASDTELQHELAQAQTSSIDQPPNISTKERASLCQTSKPNKEEQIVSSSR